MTHLRFVCTIALLFLFVGISQGQTSSGSISGIVTDQNDAAIAGAKVVATNTNTGINRSTNTNSEGRYSFTDLPIGPYEVMIEAPHFKQYRQSGIQLVVNLDANVSAPLDPGQVSEIVTVNLDASLLNKTTPEIATRFDERRLSELPTASNRSVLDVLLSVPGVSELSNGQAKFAVGISFSTNGGRLRSNNFLLDGQDMNDPVLTGMQMPLNNPDAIQEVRIVTNQFLPEYGHNSSSVVNFVGKSGTNDFHGSVFWFHNDQHLNACSNLDKSAGFCDRNASDKSKRNAPFRLENQLGFTIGGPVILPRFGEGVPYIYKGTNKTFFFTDYQRWSDHQLGSGVTLPGAPSEAGRQALKNFAGDRPQVQALLRFVPAGIPNGKKSTVIVDGGPTFDVLLGNLTGSAPIKFDSHQGSARIDHQFNNSSYIYGRYRYSNELASGGGQVTPPGLGAINDRKTKAAAIVWTWLLSSGVSNEATLAWTRFNIDIDAEDLRSKTIPSIQILDLGMTSAGPNRTAFGAPTNLPQGHLNDTYQVTDSISIVKGNHSFKFGAELRRTDVKNFFFPTGRGSLTYATLSKFVNDDAQAGSKSLPLAGGDFIQFYRWHEFYVYGQDQWKIRPNLTLSYGIRYEYPGDSFQYLHDLNQRILAANNNDPTFRFKPEPKTDVNNWMPRVGFNWNPQSSDRGVIRFITGGNKLVLRVGYARTYDVNLTSINTISFQSFPFVASQQIVGANAFTRMISTTVPNIAKPGELSRSVVSPDFRSPAGDEISFDIQRELSINLIFRLGYIRTRGTGLSQTTDGNPRVPCPFGTCNTTGIDRNTGAPIPPSANQMPSRVDPNRGPISVIANSATSTYDGLQTSLEKRLSRGVSFGVHYTWSSFIDTVSDILPPSSGDGNISQDPFDRNLDRAHSSYDRPHRLTGNVVYELPFFRKQRGFTGKILGGWQVNSFFSFQSGAPFSVLNGSDPAGANSTTTIRPNAFTNVDVSRMTVAQLLVLNQQQMAQANAQANQIFNSLTPGPCVAGWLPGPPLPFTLFSAPRGRITCDQGARKMVVDFNGIPEGQRVGNAGRNILRADGLSNVDLGIIKNTQVTENVRAQFWVDFFNVFNSRNFGIPSGVASSVGFLNQWATDGGNRRIRFGVRVVF